MLSMCQDMEDIEEGGANGLLDEVKAADPHDPTAVRTGDVKLSISEEFPRDKTLAPCSPKQRLL